ncbi:hypothetical protein FQN54_000970 [Arachnomyces sp. PD_36]|nr:hypothetical protein FQN54_000970 [Arachnomyces sp. PD_36]
MSGIETAGLVLAIFPLIVKGLSHFAEGVETVKVWRKQRRQLEEYAIQLEGHLVFWLDTLEELLEGIVDSDDVQAQMLKNPEVASLWKHPEYEERLKTRLDRSYDVYVATMSRMFEALDEVKTRLDVGKIGEVPWQDYSAVRRELKRVKLALSRKVYDELISKIDRANKDLREFTHQSRLLEDSRGKRKNRSKYKKCNFKAARECTRSLYELIIGDKIWQCRCRTRHVANLGLELQQTTEFHVLLQSDPMAPAEKVKGQSCAWELQEIKVRSTKTVTPGWSQKAIARSPVPSSHKGKPSVRFAELQDLPMLDASPATQVDGNPSAEQLIDICEAMHKSLNLKSPVQEESRSLFLDDTSHAYRHEILVLENPNKPNLHPLSSLETILSSDQTRAASRKLRLKTISSRDRVYMAAILASAVVQLDGSWLNREFRSRNINVVRRQEPYSVHTTSRLFPYISQEVFPNCRPVSQFTALDRNVIRNEVLFNLGLTLIELCFGKPLIELRQPEDLVADNEVLTNFNSAKRLLPDIFEECGGKYESAVRWCCDCPSETRDCTLEDDNFAQEVFEKIVTPLLEDWKNFNGI